jgi:hypothetical protein
MRPWFSVLYLFLALLNPSTLKADDPPLLASAGIAWPQPSLPSIQPLLSAPIDSPRAVGPQRIETEVLFGFPTELRVQWAALRGTNLAFMLEGIAGVDIIPVGFGVVGFGFAGGGGRLRWAVRNNERNAFVIKPGLDVYSWLLMNENRPPLFGADVELLWWHNCGSDNRFGLELGGDLGAFFGNNGHTWGGLPMVSAIFGLHF